MSHETETKDHAPTAVGKVSDHAVTEAVRAEIVAYGVRRATMTSIARRAGVSRATLHRRAAGVQDLVLDTLVEAFTATIVTARAAAEEDLGSNPTRRDVIVQTARRAIELLWKDNLVDALREHDPELLLPYLVTRLGRSQLLLVDTLSAEITEGQAEGSIRDRDPRVLALTVVEALTPFAVGRRLLTDAEPQTSWSDEAALLVEGYLTPAGPSGQ